MTTGAQRTPQATPPTAATGQEHELLGHPRGLFVLFFAEMWERFSYYGMRALLVLYLTKHFLFDDRMSAVTFGTYGSMVYLMPVIGGFIADRYLGFRRAVVFGGLLLCIGHLLMAFEGEPAYLAADGAVNRDESAVAILYLALAFIIMGVGFLKPSISTIVGQLYSDDDPRRDQGFTIFYMGINLGAFTAMLLCGYLGETYGWKYGFGLAGIGMLAGLFTFLHGQKHLHGAGEPNNPAVLQERFCGLRKEHVVYLGGIAGIAVVWYLVQTSFVVGWLLTLVAAAAVAGLATYALRKCDRVEQGRLIVVMALTLISVVFWTLFEQAGTSMTLFTDRNVDLDVGGVELQASQMGFLNPLFIIFLAPVFAFLWDVLSRKRWEPSAPMKFGLGVAQAGLGFFALVIGASSADDAGQVALAWLALAYLLHTTGELCLSPVGLSVVTRLTTREMLGLMMGVWFLSSAGASFLAGMIAGEATIDGAQSGNVDPTASLPVYTDVFSTLGWAGLGIGVAVMVIAPLLRRLMHEGESARQPEQGQEEEAPVREGTPLGQA